MGRLGVWPQDEEYNVDNMILLNGSLAMEAEPKALFMRTKWNSN
jgi:hypothetical protein